MHCYPYLDVTRRLGAQHGNAGAIKSRSFIICTSHIRNQSLLCILRALCAVGASRGGEAKYQRDMARGRPALTLHIALIRSIIRSWHADDKQPRRPQLLAKIAIRHHHFEPCCGRCWQMCDIMRQEVTQANFLRTGFVNP